MFSTFLNSLSGFFDKRFIIAFWMPVFLGGATLGFIWLVHEGSSEMLAKWVAFNPVLQVLYGIATLFFITVLAYLLQAVQIPIVRFFEGYSWPWWGGLRRWFIHRERIVLEKATEPDRYFYFPQAIAEEKSEYNTDRLRPTRLGNVLTSAEEHPYNLVKLDGVIWWPRLFGLLPEAHRTQIEAALTPLFALLNISMLSFFTAVIGGSLVVTLDHRWELFLLVFLGGLSLARLSYLAAVSQAVMYGNLIRSAYDLYRFKILEQMEITKPENYDVEVKLWPALTGWLYPQFDTPYSKGKDTPPWLQRPFYYKRQEEPAPTSLPKEFLIHVAGIPIIKIKGPL